MSRKRYTPEQIIRKLREAEVLISQGLTAAETARQIGVVEQTNHRCARSAAECRSAMPSG